VEPVNERNPGNLPSGETAQRRNAAAALIPLCQKGDYDAFEELFAIYKDRVYSIALRFSGDRSTAMDIAQDSFLKLLGQIQSFRGDSAFETWLFRLVVNACLDHRRRERRWLPLVEGLFDRKRGNTGKSVERGAERAEVKDRVDSAVSLLPYEQRLAVVLRYTEGLAYEEIAAAMDCSIGTVASRLNRAHRALESKLGDLRGMNQG
jgi:RNA polymerase sigma-70 factor (ECF subfamily)